jgi:predicted choloylglycine hydrolase
MNETGLALSSNTASFENTGPGIMSQVATRWVLDTCTNTQDAVAYLEQMPKVWGETYIIIDGANTIAKVEAHREKTTVTYTETGFAVNSLLYDSPDMQQYMTQERIDSCIEYTSTRRTFLSQWFQQKKGAITNQLLIEALGSHDHKMCYHGLEGLEICWSYILNNHAKTALVCAGRPCKNEYVEVKGPK